MKSRKVFSIGLALVVLLATFSVAAADVPGPGWWTAQQIQATTAGDPTPGPTLGKTTANLTAYERVSAAEFDCGSKSLDQYEAFVYYPTNSWGVTPNCGNLTAGFQGSAIVSSDYNVVAIVEETNQLAAPLGVSGGTADAAYRGTSDVEADTTLRFPAYKNDHAGETSTFYIQNAGSAATTLKATFQECAPPTPGCAGAGGTFSFTLTTLVQPNRMAIIVPGDASAPAGNGHFGSLTVESLNGQKLAGVVNEAATTSSGAALSLKSTRAFTPQEYDTTLYAPVIKHTYPLKAGAGTKWSALQIQNVGTAPGSFTIVYTIAASSDPARVGVSITDTTTCVDIPQGQTCFVMTLFPVAGSGTAQLKPGEYAAAKVTGGSTPMVAVVNEETLYNYTPAAAKQFATYSAVPDKTATLHASVPAYKEEWYGRYMGVTVQNVGGAPATVTARIKNVGVTPPAPVPAADLVAQKSNVAPGAAVTFWLLSRNQAQTYEGVTIISGTPSQFVKTNNSMDVQADQKIAVIVNQENSYLDQPAVKLDAATYEGFPLP